MQNIALQDPKNSSEMFFEFLIFLTKKDAVTINLNTFKNLKCD